MEQKKLKVVAVSYLNTKPLLYGLFKSGLDQEIDLELHMPSECAARLKAGEADIGLVPVAVIPEIPDAKIISDYCIGADGKVETVCLYSEVPLEEVREVLLDYHSRTSVQLVRILLRDHWKLSPALVAGTPGFEAAIGGTTAGLVIGDRTIGLDRRYPYVYDLAEAWKSHTGLPFVFAAWVSRREVDAQFLNQFNAALAEGLEYLPQLIYLLPSPDSLFDLEHYFTNCISYILDEPKREALRMFLEHLKPSHLHDAAVPLSGGLAKPT